MKEIKVGQIWALKHPTPEIRGDLTRWGPVFDGTSEIDVLIEASVYQPSGISLGFGILCSDNIGRVYSQFIDEETLRYYCDYVGEL